MSSPAFRNQRASRRHAVSLRCQVVRERDFRLVGDEMLDVSAEGMRVLHGPWARDVAVGERLLVTFRAPVDRELWFDTEALVTRVEHARRMGDPGRAICLSFDDLSEVARLVVQGYLRRKPPPLPRRDRRELLSGACA